MSARPRPFGALLLFAAGACLSHPHPVFAQQAPQRHALLIATSLYSKFDHGGRNIFPDLNPTCENDVEALCSILVRQYHFRWDPQDPAKSDIQVLSTPQETTRQSILTALNRLAAETKPGDTVYIHYSGHGSQVPDPNDPSGWDETLVTCDYKIARGPDGNRYETNEIRDKDLAPILVRLQAAHPKSLLLTFDCCHSGSITRGGTHLRTRGLRWDQSFQLLNPGAALPDPSSWVKNSSSNSPNSRGPELQALTHAVAGAHYVLISACRDTESAYMDDRALMGRLTVCLAQALQQSGPGATCVELFEQVRSAFHRSYPQDPQNPQMTGSGDQALLGGTGTPPKQYIPVYHDGTVATLQAGKLLGVTAGSHYLLYAIGERDYKPGSELGEAVVEPDQVGPTDARLQIIRKKPNLAPGDLDGAQAVESEHHNDGPALTLDGQSLMKALPDRASAVLARLNDLKILQVVDGTAADLRLERVPSTRGAMSLQLLRASTGAVLADLRDDPDLADQVFDAAKREAQYQLALQMHAASPAYKVDMRVRPVEVTLKKDPDSGQDYPVFKNLKPYQEGAPLHIGEYFVVQVRNSGNFPVHFAVLDLQSRGAIEPLWPDRESSPESSLIPTDHPDDWVILWNTAAETDNASPESYALFLTDTVDAREILKGIATKEFVPFYRLKTRGSEGYQNRGPFDDLLSLTVNEGTRSSPVHVPVGTWSTRDLPIAVASGK